MSQAAVQTEQTAGSKVGTGRAVVLWLVQIAVAGFLVMGGVAKLTGAPEMVGLFEAIGVGQWFRYLTGVLEVAGGVLLIVPGLAALGALLLAVVMAGAVLTHFFFIGGSAAMALVFLGVNAVILYARRGQISRLLERLPLAGDGQA